MTLNKEVQRNDRRGRTLAGLASLVLLGCDDGRLAEPAPADEPEVVEEADAAPIAAALDPVGLLTEVPVCPKSRVTVIRNAGCPTTVAGTGGKWEGGSLFPDDPPALRAVCQYKWKPNASAPPDPLPLKSGTFQAYGSDCEVNWAQGDALSDLLALPLRDVFYKHLGRLDAAGLPDVPRSPVTVALPDTASQANVEMNSEHAASMAGIIRSIACPTGATCPVNIERRLALPLLGDGQFDFLHGGFHGSQNQLALAIRSAVAAWQSAPTAGPLIVNLSLGWEPGKFGGAEVPDYMPGPVQGVFRTLQHARCHGALIFAAAGNIAGDDCVHGPLAPALWENVMGPTIAVCEASYGITPSWDPSTQPLVHAVAALDHVDRPLQGTRVGGRPRLAAPGFVAVADGPNGLTPALSGSSISSAVLSGIAALVWSYDTTMSPATVIKRIYDSGTELPQPATAQFGTNSPIHRISVCEALAEKCVGACPALPCPDTTVDTDALATEVTQAAASLPANDPAVIDAKDRTTKTSCSAGCFPTINLYTTKAVADAPGDVCEVDLVDGRDRFTDPQPSIPPCKVCFAADRTVSMVVEQDFEGLEVTSAVLEVTNTATNTGERYQLGPIERLSASERTEVTLPDDATLDATVDRAILHLSFIDLNGVPESHSNPISVY